MMIPQQKYPYLIVQIGNSSIPNVLLLSMLIIIIIATLLSAHKNFCT